MIQYAAVLKAGSRSESVLQSSWKKYYTAWTAVCFFM